MDRAPVSLPHLPALDGLRGVAVALVVIYHLSPTHLPGGFLGVDIFFVLSGFLITSLAVTEVRRRDGFRVGAFYGRRIRRLLPALLLLLLVGALYAAVWAPDHELARLREHSLWTLGYLANWRYIADGTTYTDALFGQSPLRHTWSLAIEEQFYIAFPLVVLGLGALVRWRAEVLRWTLAALAVVGAVASAGWMAAIWDRTDPSRGYFGTDTRVHSLLVGVLLGALLVGRPIARGRGAPMAAGAAAIGSLVLVVAAAGAREDSSILQHGGFLGVAVATAAVIAGSESLRPLRWLLSLRVLVALGVISYGVYLWHWPALIVLDEARTGLDGPALSMLRIAVTLVASILSYVLVEQPIRRRRLGAIANRPAFALSATAAGVATVAAVVLVTTVVPASTTVGPRPRTQLDPEVAAANGLPVDMVMFGDSVARSLSGAGLDYEDWRPEQSSFDAAYVRLWNLSFIYCSYLQGVQILADGRPNYDSLILCSAWAGLLTDVLEQGDYEYVLAALANDAGDRLVDDELVELGTPRHQELLDDFLDELRAVTQRHGAELLLLALPPPADDAPTVDGRDASRMEVMREELRTYAASHPGVRLLDLYDQICPQGDCSDPADGFDPSWRSDGVHFTPEGARWVADWITAQLVDPSALASSEQAAGP